MARGNVAAGRSSEVGMASVKPVVNITAAASRCRARTRSRPPSECLAMPGGSQLLTPFPTDWRPKHRKNPEVPRDQANHFIHGPDHHRQNKQGNGNDSAQERSPQTEKIMIVNPKAPNTIEGTPHSTSNAKRHRETNFESALE